MIGMQQNDKRFSFPVIHGPAADCHISASLAFQSTGLCLVKSYEPKIISKNFQKLLPLQ